MATQHNRNEHAGAVDVAARALATISYKKSVGKRGMLEEEEQMANHVVENALNAVAEHKRLTRRSLEVPDIKVSMNRLQYERGKHDILDPPTPRREEGRCKDARGFLIPPPPPTSPIQPCLPAPPLLLQIRAQ